MQFLYKSYNLTTLSRLINLLIKSVPQILFNKQRTIKKIARAVICVGLSLFNSSQAMETAKQDYDHARILQLVEEEVKNIGNVNNKDVVIVIGRSQVGKSTTINALLGADLQYNDEGEIILDKASSEPVNYAEVGGRGISCTILPHLYSGRGNFAFLDTRGFFDVRMDKEGDIAGSILIEMAVKNAKSVRMMIIEDYNNIQGGVVSFRAFGETLSKIAVGNQIPTLLVFNRYSPPQHTALAFYQKSFEKQQPLIHDAISKAIDKILAGEEEIKQTIGQKIASKYGKAFKGNSSDQEIVQDPEFQRLLKGVNYTHILKHNKDLGNIAYIDPTSKESINFVMQSLEKLNPIAPRSLAFNGYTSDRLEFDRAFAEGITPFLGLLKCKAKITNYSPELLEELHEEAQHCADYHEKMLPIAAGEKPITLETLETLELAYTIKSEDLKKQKDRIWRDKRLAEQKKLEINKEISNLINGKPILYWKDRWYLEMGFWKWWRDYRCSYSGTPKIQGWQQTLRNGTSLDRIVQYEDNRLELEFTSQCGYDCAGEVRVYVAPEDDPSIVTLIKTKQADIKAIEASISEYDQSLIDLNKTALSQLKDKVSSRLRIFKEQTAHLRRAIELRTKVDNLYKASAAKIETYVRIADKLESDKPIVEELRKFYKEFLTLVSKEKKELPNILNDNMFACLMLDPVQVICQGSETHGHSYERRMIAEYLDKKKSCPICREVTSTLIPIGSLQLKANKIIDGIYNDTLYAEKLLESIQDSLNNS